MKVTDADVEQALIKMQIARESGDQLKADLAEEALNDLLDRYLAQSHLSHVTTKGAK